MEKTKIRAIILDYGGVISKPQNLDNVDNMIQFLNQDYNEFIKIYLSNRGSYDSGQLSGKEYWQRILQQFGLEFFGSKIDKLIHEDVESWTKINDSMIKFVEEVRSNVRKVAMISNMTRDTLVYMKLYFQWLDFFDELIFSCDLGINKPDSRIYDACLRKIEISPKECLFVDDSMQNVEGAMAVGMNAIHFESYEQFAQVLNQNFHLSK